MSGSAIRSSRRPAQSRTPGPLACVLGSMDLVRPLGLAGIPCAVVAPERTPPRYSRFARATVEWVDPWTSADELVERLVGFARARPEPPVLFYEEDRDLLLVSRHRDRLAAAFRFVVAESTLVEDLADKARFQALAEALRLPVPPSRRLAAMNGAPGTLDLRFPVILKPLTRRGFERWKVVAGSEAKGLLVESPRALAALWRSLRDAELEVLAQEAIPGPETAIESYHVYVDAGGAVVAEFTGKKIRTRPSAYGFSTALVTTDSADVAELGRELTLRLRLRGVGKLDFKRDSDGTLYLLEVNPRFNLWHHLGARAGVNLPALVYADLTGRERPPVGRARAGTRWCDPVADAFAAREARLPLVRWVPWMLGCEAKSTLALDDPMPFVGGIVWRHVRRRLAGANGRGGA